MKRKSIIIAAAVAATVGAGALVFSNASFAQPYGGGWGYMGPGMMGGYGPGPGMMGGYGPGYQGHMGYGPGPGYGPGYMHGRRGYGPGWMHGRQGYGPGWMHGQRGYGPAWCWGNRDGVPTQSQSGQATPQQGDEKQADQKQTEQKQTDQKQQTDQKLTTDDVKTRMERWLSFQHNPRLKLGDVKEKDDNTITADIVTVDNSLVRRFNVDRNTGIYRPE